MRSLFIIVLLVAAVEALLVAGALLGYVLFQLLSESGSSLPFHKYTHYSSLALALLASLAWLCSPSGAAERLLAGPPSRAALRLGGGALLGLLLLLVLELLLMLGGARGFAGDEFSWGGLAVQLGKGLGTGSAVGLLEEIIFRGALLGILLRLLGLVPAVLLSSLLFSLLHLLRPVPLPAGLDPAWYSGLELLWQAHLHTWRVLPAQWVQPAMLFMLGLLLAQFRLRSRVLWPCIGLHLGLVAGLRIAHYCNYTVPAALPLWLYDPLTYPAGGLALALLGFCCLLLLLAPTRELLLVEPDEQDPHSGSAAAARRDLRPW